MSSRQNSKLRAQAQRVRQKAAGFLSACRQWGARRRPFLKRTQAATDAAAESWAVRLADEKQILLSLIQSMETEFLETGKGLMRLSQQLSGIQHVSQSLSELTMGQAEDAAVQFAFQLLKKAEDLVLASYDQYDHVFLTFGELQQRLAQLATQHNDLMRVLQPLQFITTALRIEASRQPPEVQEVFVTLATDLNRTVSEVRATLERQFAGLAEGERIVQTLMTQLSASIRLHRQEVTAALAASRDHLRALGEALANSGAGAADLSRLNQKVRRHIGGIVMAQQCQDITRQKIDHVGEAMDEMRVHLDEARPAGSAAAPDPRPFVFHAAQIQLQQIQSVFGELNRAADGLTSGIESLRIDAGAAAAVAVKVGGTTLDAKVASLCEAGIVGVLKVIDEAVQRIAEILSAFAPLQASFVNCTAKATELAGNVRHAALNAQVFAIHAPHGATLEVLAGRVSAVSDEAIAQVQQMGAALNHTGALVNNLQQRLTDFQELGQAEQEVLNAESALSRKKLLELEKSIPVLIQRITAHQADFAQSVEAVLAKVQFPVTVAESRSRSLGLFNDLVEWCGPGDTDAPIASEASLKIDALKANYTMASERHVHTAAFLPAAVAAAGPSIKLFDEMETPLPASVAPACEISVPEERRQAQPPPADLSASVAAPLAAAPDVATEKSAVNADMGENVELF